MKRYLKYSAITIALVLTWSGLFAQGIKYEIRGKIGSYSAPAKAYLMRFVGGQNIIDSTIIDHGSFKFSGISEYPITATLFINSKGSGYNSNDIGFRNFYIEPGLISINNSDSLRKAEINAGQLNKDYDELNQNLSKVEVKLDQIYSVFDAAPPEKQKLGQFRDSVINETLKIEDEKKPIALEFIKKHPSSLVSLTALLTYAGLYPDSRMVEPAFKLLSSEVRLSRAGLNYAAEIEKMKKATIGFQAPDFTLNDTLGKPVSLHDLKGKYVLIDFWASWCVPCRAENPNLINVYNNYQKRNFTILGISLDNDKGKGAWLKAIKDDHLPWTQVMDLTKDPKNDARAIYNIVNIPQNVLISPNGQIIAKNLRGEQLRLILEKLLN